jgi:hypothetical protein
MNLIGSAFLEFDQKRDNLSKGIELSDGLSAIVRVGDTLWVANDETISLERLSFHEDRLDGTYTYNNHRQFALNDYLRLPVPPPSEPEGIEEVDIEGLNYHEDYLWLVGSHSLVRSKPFKELSTEQNIVRLKTVSGDGNRFLLARIPLDKDVQALSKEIKKPGKNLSAAQVHGDQHGNDLTAALREDGHLKGFIGIPGKDNGLDIEGLAVADEQRLFIGLRGPVLRGYTVILELELQEDGGAELRLKKIGPGDQPYRKHFLHLGGLGIRDLCVQDSDLLILAGPTMDLDGPVKVFRWPGGAQPKQEESLVRQGTLQAIMDIPFGQGEDHAEGITLFSPNGSDDHSLLVVYDSASKQRKMGNSTYKADIFSLP